MNLLHDVREELGQASEEKSATGTLDEPTQQQPEVPSSRGIDLTSRYPSYKKSRSSLKPFLLIAAFLIVVSAAVYLIIFRGRQKGFEPSTDITAAVEPDSTSLQQPSTPLVADAPVEPLPYGGERESPATDDALRGSKGLRVLTSAMSVFSQSLPADVRLGTLFMDESNLTADFISAGGMESFYSLLLTKCPPEVVLAGLPKTGTSDRTLISGSFNLSNSDFVRNSSSQEVDIEKEVRALAATAGVQVINLNIGQIRSLDNFKNREIFIKVDGGLPACQSFFEGIARKQWNLRVSKILLMPTAGQNATLVLRFQKVESFLG